ncbi:hypothetical protein IAT38_002641 [Cryptococcus sp. DSM 104549]
MTLTRAPVPPDKKWRPSVGCRPPYMTPMPHARVGFNDLPMEVVTKILQYVEKLHGLLLTCKRTCIPAGEMLYANGPVCVGDDPYLGRRYPDGRRAQGARLIEVMRGLNEGDGVTARRPFGNALKRRFMRQLTSLTCHALSEKERSDYGSAILRTHGELLELIDIFHDLILEGVEPFPALQEVVFTRGHDPDARDLHISHYVVDWTRMVRMLAMLCRPRSFEWAEQKFPPDVRTTPSVRALLNKINSNPELRFAGGHLPAVVQHNVQHFPSCELEYHPIPLPCYGTYNIVYVEPLCVGVETKYGCAAYMEEGLEELHPELSEEGEDVFLMLDWEERERREATTWEFAWSAPSMFDLYFRPMEILENMLDEIWGMVLDLAMVKCGRVGLSSPDIWRRRENWDMEQEWREWVETGEHEDFYGPDDYWEERLGDESDELDCEIGERDYRWDLAEQHDADERMYFHGKGGLSH